MSSPQRRITPRNRFPLRMPSPSVSNPIWPILDLKPKKKEKTEDRLRGSCFLFCCGPSWLLGKLICVCVRTQRPIQLYFRPPPKTNSTIPVRQLFTNTAWLRGRTPVPLGQTPRPNSSQKNIFSLIGSPSSGLPRYIWSFWKY